MNSRLISNADGTISHRCPICEGCSHPSTGCAYGPTFVVCWRCTTEGWVWILNHVNSKGRRGGGPSFYDHVGEVQHGNS